MTGLVSALSSVEAAARTGLLLCAGPRGMEYICPQPPDTAHLSRLRAVEDILLGYRPESPAGIHPVPSNGHLPASDIQARQLLTFKNGARADPYVASASRLLKAPLLPAAAARAAVELEARHGVLQYDIEERAEEFWHVRRTAPGVALQTCDLSQIPDETLSSALQNATSWLVSEANNLGRRPHCRLAVIRIAGGILVLALAMDHIFSDLFSVRLVLNDFISLYRRILGHSVPLLPLQAGYERYLRRLTTVEPRCRKFWSLYLAGASQPEFRRKPKTGPTSHEARLSESRIGTDSYERMKAITRQAGGTIFATALAKVFVLLRAISGQSDVTLGVVYDNRDMGNATVAGLIVDTIFVRARAEKHLDAGYVSYVWSSTRAALRHAKTPRGHVTAGTGLTHPRVLVNFMSIPAQKRNLVPPSPTTASIPSAVSIAQETLGQVFREETRTMPQLLYIMLNDSGHDLHARIFYNPQYFDEAECHEMHRILRDA